MAIQDSQKPVFLIISVKNLHLTLSYALLISSFRVIKFAFFDFWVFIWCSNSKATKILSEIALFDLNALCDSEIMKGNTFLSLFATILENNFQIILQRAIESLVNYLFIYLFLCKSIKVINFFHNFFNIL